VQLVAHVAVNVPVVAPPPHAKRRRAEKKSNEIKEI